MPFLISPTLRRTATSHDSRVVSRTFEFLHFGIVIEMNPPHLMVICWYLGFNVIVSVSLNAINIIPTKLSINDCRSCRILLAHSFLVLIMYESATRTEFAHSSSSDDNQLSICHANRSDIGLGFAMTKFSRCDLVTSFDDNCLSPTDHDYMDNLFPFCNPSC